jgi:hypothetical protein
MVGCFQCSSQGPDDFLPFRMPSDYIPIACMSSANRCIWSSAGTKLKVTLLALQPLQLSGNARKREQKRPPFAQKGYKPYDAVPQPVVFVENLECTPKVGLFAVLYLERSSPGDGVGDVYFGLLDKPNLKQLFGFSNGSNFSYIGIIEAAGLKIKFYYY